MALSPRKRVAEQRRDRDIVRKALERFLVVLAPITAAQLFTGPDNKPLDTRHHGLPPYGRRALERLRDDGVIALDKRYYRVLDKSRLEAVLADDDQLDRLHLADKYLPKAKEKVDPEQIAAELEELVGAEGDESEYLDDDLQPNEVAPHHEPQEPQAGDEVPFPIYTAKRFDMLQELLVELSESLPTDTKTHLEALGETVQGLKKDFESLVEIFFKTATVIDNMMVMVSADHEFLAELRASLRPRQPEATHNVQQ